MVESQTGVEALPTPGAVTGVDASAAEEVAREQAGRPREEMRMLLLGFGTGMVIGGFFLIYVVLAIGHVGQ